MSVIDILFKEAARWSEAASRIINTHSSSIVEDADVLGCAEYWVDVDIYRRSKKDRRIHPLIAPCQIKASRFYGIAIEIFLEKIQSYTKDFLLRKNKVRPRECYSHGKMNTFHQNPQESSWPFLCCPKYQTIRVREGREYITKGIWYSIDEKRKRMSILDGVEDMFLGVVDYWINNQINNRL